jgi:predicted transglutaminase-like cysteine proteinase
MGERRLHTPARGWRIAAIAFGFAIASLVCASASAEQLATLSTAPLFGTTEIASHDLAMFPKWRHALQAFAEEVKNCRAGRCDNNERQAAVEGLRGKDLMAQLRETNVRFNEKQYVADDVNWDLPDYWATPFEFLSKAGGDCEDYAIAKYMMLRDGGIAADDMRIVVLRDLKLRVDHAVLAVYINGTPYILDNRYASVVPASSIHNYQPVYSINEHGWWLHRRPLDSSTLTRGSEKHLIATKMPAAPVIGVGVGSTFAAQLASLPTNADAIQVGTEIQARYSAVLEGLSVATLRVDLGAKGIWYRVLAGPFGSHHIASNLCAQIRAVSSPTNCIVIAMQHVD